MGVNQMERKGGRLLIWLSTACFVKIPLGYKKFLRRGG